MKVCSVAAGGSEGGCLKTSLFLQDGIRRAAAFQATACTHSSKSSVQLLKHWTKMRKDAPKNSLLIIHETVNGKLCLQVKLRSSQKAGYHSTSSCYRRSASPTDSLQLPSARCTFVKINLEYARLTGLSPCLHRPFTHVYTAALRQLLSCSAVPCYPRPAKLCFPRGVTRARGSRQQQGCRAPLADEPRGRSPNLPAVRTLDNGKAQIQPSLVIRRFLVPTARKHFHLTICRQMWFGTSPFSQSDILLPTVGAEGRP